MTRLNERPLPQRYQIAMVAVAVLTVMAIGLTPSEAARSPELTAANRLVRLLDLPAPDPNAVMVPRATIAPVAHVVASGETLASILEPFDMLAADTHALMQADGAADLAALRARQTLRFTVVDDVLLAIATRNSDGDIMTASRDDRTSAWVIDTTEQKIERRIRYANGAIDGSLYLSGQRAGLSDRIIMRFAEVFGWDIDFVHDIRAGDTFTVVYERLYRDGEFWRDGDIIAATFVNRGKEFQAVHYTDSAGESDFYAADGRAMRKAFLRSPLDVTRVTSRFTMRRFHPVLKTYRPHRGVDYGARTGTPVKVTGNGRVIHAGFANGYGNHIIVQHGDRYKTLYAHLSKMHVRKGDRVSQGDMIGRVGSTGLSTGPHLHYEFRVNNKHVDPLTIDLPQAEQLADSEMASFATYSRPLLSPLRHLAALDTHVFE